MTCANLPLYESFVQATSTTLSDHRSHERIDVISSLCLSVVASFATLPRGAVATAPQRAGVARPLERVARAVRGLLHARGAARRVSTLPARVAERQPAE